jgi:hypothetical protein
LKLIATQQTAGESELDNLTPMEPPESEKFNLPKKSDSHSTNCADLFGRFHGLFGL